jgi:hypothetical protein
MENKEESKLNGEKIWKIGKTIKLNAEKVWKIRKKSRFNCEMI